MELQPGYETVWHNRNGWFKLTHVCRSWRRLVHSSPSRSHVHLLFNPRRSSRVTMLRSLPPFPILVDYRVASWTEREENRALAAISRHSRVRGIALRCSGRYMVKILRALSHPFPKLESLEICRCDHNYKILPTSLSAPCLQKLTLREVIPRCLSPLLSTATGLVELTLTLTIADSALPEASFIANLQRMSCLCRLELKMRYHRATISNGRRPPAGAGDIVPLSKLMQLVFAGGTIYLEALLAALAAPSLQHLDAEVGGATDAFPIPHLCRFICGTDNQLNIVHMDFLHSQFKFTAEARPQSVHAQPYRIVFTFREPFSLEEMGNRLSGPLSAVEELVVGGGPWFIDHVQWRRFFDHFQRVKLFRYHRK
jgi:hypothetical protein